MAPLASVSVTTTTAAAAPAAATDPVLTVPGEQARSAISVATLAATMRDVIEGSFPPLWVHGEVVGFKQHRNGHWYFTLKDDAAQVRCVVWASDVRRMITAPDEGMAVVVRGQLTVYEARSEVQFRVSALQGVGDGLWRKAFEEARSRLDASGLLAPDRKRRLPSFPRRIAVITSLDGAALHDIVAVAHRRCPMCELVVVPAAVQGDSAPESLLRALALVSAWGRADLVIIGRGGGSREDLWAFNDERVARALAACPVPTISAVGHEVDVTLCDLVADLRAPTPSAAAEAAVPVLADLTARLRALGDALRVAAQSSLDDARRSLQVAAERLAGGAGLLVERRRAVLETLAGRLNALSPVGTMSRGYAMVTDDHGGAITRAAALSPGDAFRVMFRDGRVLSRAERIDPTPL